MSANTIRKDIDELMLLCDKIGEEQECDDCPLLYNCLKEDTIEDIWSEVSEKRIKDFIEYADNIDKDEDEITEEDEYINANYLHWKEEYYEDKYGK